MSAPKQLTDVNWKLNLQLAHAKMASTKEQSALIEFSLTDQNGPSSLVVEFTKEELSDFFSKLEQMQSQLDALL
ncbi:hypothetical protein BV898_10011 [Hypsibius exemplaris]|uniref:COMM domain-containing protein n=1 Tax=Hypsibius exemplaris TaxID=2072580 RepID=A0A1W0WL17_HYPEX|nr:hypothetical protein BV898_10011 [Hypsibius exemplaris]